MLRDVGLTEIFEMFSELIDIEFEILWMAAQNKPKVTCIN